MNNHLVARNLTFNCSKLLLPANFGRLFSTKTKNELSDKDWHTVCLDSGVIACWHPSKPFPYEYSKPIDLKDYLEDKKRLAKARDFHIRKIVEKPYGKPGPKNVELSEIFYTDKHEWKTRTREDKLYATSFPTPKRK